MDRAKALVVLVCTALACIGCESGVRNGGGGAITVWAIDETRELSADATPVRENEIFSAAAGSIRLRSGTNDVIAFVLALRPEGNSGGAIGVEIDDLQGDGGKLLARDAVRVFRVHPIRIDQFRSWYPAHTGRAAEPIDVLDVLVPWDAPRGGGPVNLDARRTEYVWVDVAIPAGTQPGVYRAGLRCTRSGRAVFRGLSSSTAIQSLTIELDVAPLEFPSQPSLPVICRVDPRDLLAVQAGWPAESAEETRLLPEVSSHQAAIRVLNSTMELFHEHRCAPVLWGSFPKYRPLDERSVEIDWSAYDALVEGWLDGGAFHDRTPAAIWPLPVSAEYPSAERNGGFGSPSYARLLGAYVAACRKHFVERGWEDRAFVRIVPPAPLGEGAVLHNRRVLSILKQAETATPVAAHLAPGSLRALGWFEAPQVDLPEMRIWCPPAGQWDTARMAGAVDQRKWFQPSEPPYSPSLSPAAPTADASALGWLAFRYGADGIWIENAANIGKGRGIAASPDRSPDALLYPGVEFGVTHTPLASVRLKRLRRSILDHMLLTQLDAQGKSLLARRTAEQIVRWGFSDACTRDLVTTRQAGWVSDALAYSLARQVLIAELAGGEVAAGAQGASLQTEWSRFMTQGIRLEAESVGVRLSESDEALRADVFATLSNTTALPLTGTWELNELPPGWTRLSGGLTEATPRSRAIATVPFRLAGLTYNAAGVLELPLVFRGDAGEAATTARLAVASCPLVDHPPTIDGDLSDWPMAPTNTAGDFQLVRGAGRGGADGVRRTPMNATKAFFCMDAANLYFAFYCATARGEPPLFRSDNIVTMDGAIPWGQDLIEVLLSPTNARAGGGGDLLCLQIKPSGVVVSRKGTLTDPPMNASQLWQSQARVATRVSGEGWTVELTLPLASLEAAGPKKRIWGCNLTRLDSRRGEYSSWSGARGNTYSPETLGNLILQRP
ncbi:MAG: hypothetical protein HZB38_16870 [Planctomycetes bacterium]|nr:hypothetical protein [Planctomycetota bacterium]